MDASGWPFGNYRSISKGESDDHHNLYCYRHECNRMFRKERINSYRERTTIANYRDRAYLPGSNDPAKRRPGQWYLAKQYPGRSYNLFGRDCNRGCRWHQRYYIYPILYRMLHHECAYGAAKSCCNIRYTTRMPRHTYYADGCYFGRDMDEH